MGVQRTNDSDGRDTDRGGTGLGTRGRTGARLVVRRGLPRDATDREVAALFFFARGCTGTVAGTEGTEADGSAPQATAYFESGEAARAAQAVLQAKTWGGWGGEDIDTEVVDDQGGSPGTTHHPQTSRLAQYCGGARETKGGEWMQAFCGVPYGYGVYGAPGPGGTGQEVCTEGWGMGGSGYGGEGEGMHGGQSPGMRRGQMVGVGGSPNGFGGRGEGMGGYFVNTGCGYGVGSHVRVSTNPADQNPPCNTLYVGNLPVSTTEEELRSLFSRQPGYRRLCYRTKSNGPMCFVEFEDVGYAMKALGLLQGVCLSSSVKGGIRLSFSKNPLGVRSSGVVVGHYGVQGNGFAGGLHGQAGFGVGAAWAGWVRRLMRAGSVAGATADVESQRVVETVFGSGRTGERGRGDVVGDGVVAALAEDMFFGVFFEIARAVCIWAGGKDGRQEAVRQVAFSASHPVFISFTPVPDWLGFFEKVPSSLPTFQLHYWGSIFESLKKLGCQVYVTRVPSTGTIAHRARELSRQLSLMVKGKRVNLVAHSMVCFSRFQGLWLIMHKGGLDCRYLLSKRLYTNYYPVSLTTLSCPHRGSPFMDWCRDYLGLGRVFPHSTGVVKDDSITKNARFSSSSCKKNESNSSISSTILTSIMFSQTMDTPAYANLTTTYLKESFNPFILDSLEVKYYSFAAVASSVPIWHPLYLPNHVVSQAEGIRNDGLVSVESATWGKLLGILDCDHWELRGRRIGVGTAFSKRNFDVNDFYCALATHLWNESF
ncbi:hypothetical protein PMAC_000979 [Pneumocystis sp. 'macacae']|nr:hypothetical protein PMAC_000979 [Pneumocystis sp. 'macacae']